MGTFGVDLNFDYGNLKLGKLFEDANKSGAANLSSNQSSINSNFNANIASNYGGSNSSSVETLDLSSSVENKNNSVNINPNNTTSNSTITSNQMNDSSNVNINAGKMNEGSQNSTLGNSNVNTNSQNSGGINLNTSNSGTNTSSNMDNSNSYGINNGNDSVTRNNGINLNSGKLNGTSNENNSNNIEVSQESNNTSSSGSMNNSNLSKNGTNSNRGAVEQQDNSVDISINMDTQETSDSSSSFNIKEGKVIITTVDQSGNPIDIEIDVDDYINNLKLFGFNEKDINRIINGEISPEKLIEEIQNDSDNKRRKQMMESSYLQAYGLSFTNMEELNKAINENAIKLKELMQSRNEVDDRELDSTMKIISRLKMGESLENILKSEVVAWKYVDENGNVCYRYDDPYITGNYEGINYEALYYKDVYGNSNSFKELKNVLVEQTIDPLFGDEYIVHRWEENEEQSLYFDKIAKEYSDNIEKRKSKLEEIDKQISQLQEQQANYQYIYEYINSEVNYYIKNIDTYTSKNDFLENIYFNSSCVESLNSIKDKYNNSYNYDMYGTGVSTIYVNKSELVNVIACMINGEGNINEGYLSIGNSIYQLSSTDDMLAHYVKWLPFISQSEIEVFNYIYNTEGEDSAYKYLEDISDELDNRWLANKTKEDQEFASEHPFLASVASIVVTPFEGISAACYSLNSYFTGEKIRRADVYSAGDVWRGQVSEDIAENYGEGWAFVYNTGMSMADTGTLIALSLATGGTATPVLSATLMGSRAYVSTLNDALDRGLSDGAAIGLAFSSAIIESAMESYSVGHLLNLETALGGSTSKLVSKVAESIADPTLASIATKTTYIAASALSQGLCEGEEEFATEILNYVADNLISGELSNHSITINNYISLGYTEDEARQLANEDFASQLQQAFLGGFVSGVCFGTFGGVKTTNSVSKDIANNITIDYEGTKAQLFASGIEINRLQQLNIEEQQKNENKQKLINLGNQIKSIFTQNTFNSISVEIDENTQNIINNLNSVYDLVVSDGTIEKLISKAKGKNGKIAGVELFRMLGYDIKPTVVSENEFLDLSNNSEYGVIARGISGPNSEQYAEQLRNGDMYVGGEHAAIKGTGIYTGFGLSVDKISEKYATRAGTTEDGTVVKMVLSPDAKVIDYEAIVIEQTEVLDIMSKEFNKYSSSIVDFDTLLGNLDKITNEIDLQKAKFITNFLMDTGYYAALQGYDAIVDGSVNYLTVLNRGKLLVKSNNKVTNLFSIDNEIADVIDVSKLDMRGGGLDKSKVNINQTYKGFDYVVKPKSDLLFLKNEIINNNDGSKILIELSNINDLNFEMIEEIPDNVSIRISNYNMDFYRAFKHSPQFSTNYTLEHLTYNITELKAIMNEINNINNNIDSSWNQYQKANYIYNYLKENIKYEPNPGDNNIRPRTKQMDGLMSLVTKESTCQGFAHTYNILLNNLGIKSFEVWGSLDGEGQHAYNIVNIDNNNFIVDTTRESLEKNSPGKYEGTGFGVQNISQYVSKSNIDLYNSINSNIDNFSNEIVQSITTDNSTTEFDSNRPSIDELLSRIDSKLSELEELDETKSENIETINEQIINLTDIVDPEVAAFIVGYDYFKERVKDFNNMTDEELPHFEVFRTKIIEYGSVENILNNLDTFTEWEMGRLLDSSSPILTELFNNQNIIDYIKKNVSKEVILNNYSLFFPNHPLIISTFLSLTTEEINDLGSWTIFNKFNLFSLEIQKQFIESHTDFFEKEKESIFYKSLNKDAFLAIFDKVGSYEFLKSKMWNISSLSSEIQIELYNKYKSTIYNGTQKDFIEFAGNLNDDNYQTDFIKSSPFYSEIINSTKFETLFSKIKSKEFALELFKDSDARIKIENSPDAFKNLISLLSVEEQYKFKEIAKEKILDINNTSDSSLMIWGPDKVYSYISGFNEVIQNELLSDLDIINSMSMQTMIKLNEKFKGVYLEQMKNMINGNFNAESAKLLFEPSIFQLMDQDTINRAALALKCYEYDKLAKLGNTEAINVVIDKIVANNFSEISNYYSNGLISLYEATDELGKQKIADNISFSVLVSTISSYKGEQFTDILVNRLSSSDAPMEIKITDLRKISQFKPESYEKIFSYLSSKQKLVTFNYDIVTKLGLTEEFIDIFRENPSLINYMDTYNKGPLNFLKLLSTNDDMEIFYSNITLKTLFDVGNSPEFNIMNLEKVKNILKDGLSSYNFMYFNEFSGLARILDNYSVLEQLEILNTMEAENKYFLLLNGNIKNKETKFEMIKLMMNDPTFRTSISDDNIENFKGFFDNLEVEYIDYILKNADNHFLGFMLTITKRNDLNLKFNEMINENSLILNEFEYSDAELIYGNLSNENKILLDNKINSMISNIGNEKISILFSEATTAQKSSFLDAYNKGLVTNEKIDLLTKIKSKNKFVLSTFNYSLFDETIYQFGEVLLTKLSKYYDVVDQIVELKNNSQKFKLFAQFVINDYTSSSAIVADQKMAMLLNYLLENDVDPVLLSVSNLTELEVARNIILKQIDQFSILDGTMQEIIRDRRIIVPDGYTLANYDLKLAEKCDSLLKEATTVDDVQNLIFNKYFSISIEDATELFRMYGSRFSEIKNLDSTGVATTYLENMQNILNITTMEEATDIYNSFTGINRYNMNETLNIINSIKKIYTKSLKNTLFNPTEVTGYVEYDGKKIPIYEPKGDFQMLIQSTYTNYGGMPMINDNYFDSWNLSSRTANHGICCSLISNNNMGMAMVRGPGVVIGFNSFSDEQMNMMAPYDIYTRNDGYVIKCQRPLLYLPGQDVMNETRHTHNEFNLERTNLTGEGELANIQPDYVVVFEEMSEEQKQNAYKASVDFNIPLVYINKTSLAASESTKIDNLISEYNSSGNIELLKEILVLHENNRSGYRNPTDSSLVTQYFSSERISNVLNNAILQSNAEELIYIKEFLEDELRKFDTTLEATHRANEIDIDAKGLIELIDRRHKILQDLEKTRNLEFNTNIDTNDPDVTARTISIGNLLRLVTDENYFTNFELNNFDFSDFSKEEYNVGIIQLVHAIKKNSYDLGLNETENKRLDYLYNKALETLPNNKIQYDEFLPNDFKLRLMFENNIIYSEKDLFILYDYYLEKFSPEILYNDPILIYSSEFKFYLNVLGNYVSINSNQLSNLDVDFWNHLITAKKDCENIIIEDKIDIGEQEFKNLVSNIYNWHQNEREYVDYFSNYYDVDVSNMNYDQSLPNSLKLRIMIRDNIIYDRSLVINEFNKIITKESINDYNLIFNDLFMFYFRNISANLTTEEVNKTYSFENCNNIYLNNLNKIIIGNIDITEEQFRKLLSMVKIQGLKVENYINNYLENHKEINLSGALDSIQYNDKLPVNLKDKIIIQILSEYDWFILQNSSDVYGSDQNAVSKYIQIEGNNLNWLTDENDFINYLVTKREYNQNNANKLLQDLKSTNGVFTINDARTGSILIEYIFDKCARENRFDVLDIFNQSFRFKYNSEIQRLGNKLMNKGMSYVEALRTLCAIDSTGCCSYASIVNSILLSYKNNPQAFETDFGYPLYVYIDGKQEFNAAELLLDMYIYLNSNKFSDNYYHYKGKMFNYDQNGLLHIDELNTNNQVYLSGYTWQNLPAINSFLASKKSTLSYRIEGGDVYGEGHTPSTRENVAKMKEEIINYLKQSANNSVELGLRRTEKNNLFVKKVIPFRFMTKPGEVYVTTETWNEGGGHAVCITGVLDDYFVVSSWGKRLLIPIEDFTNNNFNVIFRNMEGIK